MLVCVTVYKEMSDAVTKHPEVDMLVNFASLRSAYDTSVEAMALNKVHSTLLLYIACIISYIRLGNRYGLTCVVMHRVLAIHAYSSGNLHAMYSCSYLWHTAGLGSLAMVGGGGMRPQVSLKNRFLETPTFVIITN